MLAVSTPSSRASPESGVLAADVFGLEPSLSSPQKSPVTITYVELFSNSTKVHKKSCSLLDIFLDILPVFQGNAKLVIIDF